MTGDDPRRRRHSCGYEEGITSLNKESNCTSKNAVRPGGQQVSSKNLSAKLKRWVALVQILPSLAS